MKSCGGNQDLDHYEADAVFFLAMLTTTTTTNEEETKVDECFVLQNVEGIDPRDCGQIYDQDDELSINYSDDDETLVDLPTTLPTSPPARRISTLSFSPLNNISRPRSASSPFRVQNAAFMYNQREMVEANFVADNDSLIGNEERDRSVDYEEEEEQKTDDADFHDNNDEDIGAADQDEEYCLFEDVASAPQENQYLENEEDTKLVVTSATPVITVVDANFPVQQRRRMVLAGRPGNVDRPCVSLEQFYATFGNLYAPCHKVFMIRYPNWKNDLEHAKHIGQIRTTHHEQKSAHFILEFHVHSCAQQFVRNARLRNITANKVRMLMEGDDEHKVIRQSKTIFLEIFFNRQDTFHLHNISNTMNYYGFDSDGNIIYYDHHQTAKTLVRMMLTEYFDLDMSRDIFADIDFTVDESNPSFLYLGARLQFVSREGANSFLNSWFGGNNFLCVSYTGYKLLIKACYGRCGRG